MTRQELHFDVHTGLPSENVNADMTFLLKC